MNRQYSRGNLGKTDKAPLTFKSPVDEYNWNCKNNPMWTDPQGHQLTPIKSIEPPPDDLNRFDASFDQLLRYGLVEYRQEVGWMTQAEFDEFLRDLESDKTKQPN